MVVNILIDLTETDFLYCQMFSINLLENQNHDKGCDVKSISASCQDPNKRSVIVNNISNTCRFFYI